MISNPIANIRTVADPKDCIAILSALSVLGSREGPFTVDKLRQLIAAEAHFRTLLDREKPGYFAAQDDEARRAQTDTFAKHMQLVHSHFASAFQRYVMRKDEWLAAAEDAHLLKLATAHAIANFAALVKWSYFLHETLKSTSWSELHALYYLAEQQAYHHQPLDLYGARAAYNPSIHSLYLRALVLDIMNPGSLSAKQIEIAEAWLAAWCADYSLESQFQPRSHLIYVDLAEHSGFHLLTPGVQGDTIRYLRADALRGQLEEVKAELRQGGLYPGLGSAVEFPVEEHVALLSSMERVYQSILAKSGNRIEARTQAQDLVVEVTLGIDAIVKTLDASSTSTSLALEPATQATGPELWRVHDYSSSGFGLLVDRATGECVPLQTLIALRSPGGQHWALGAIVRKLTNRVQGQTLIGIEMLSFRPLLVRMNRLATTPAELGETTIGVYVPGKDADGKRDFLVLHQTDFSTRNLFEIASGGVHFRVRLNRAVKKGIDWIAMRFEVDNKR